MKVTGLCKSFEVFRNPWQALLGELSRFPGVHKNTSTALENIEFEAAPGEIFGVIGRNGSGKTTLLRILAGTLEASSGTLESHGRIAAVLDVDSGFIPELSGLTNLKLSAPLAGFKKGEIAPLIESITQFSELGNAIENPVKTYSMGMLVRLGFSLAIHQPFDILLVDEVLSVGDAGFAAKCIRRIRELSSAGKTIIVASHNLGLVSGLCKRAMVLSKGREIYQGDVNQAIGAYWKLIEKEQGSIYSGDSWSGSLAGDGRARIEKIVIIPDNKPPQAGPLSAQAGDGPAHNGGGQPQAGPLSAQAGDGPVRSGMPCTVHIFVQAYQELSDVVVRVQWLRNDGYLASGLNSCRSGFPLNLSVGRHRISIHYPAFGLLKGDYYLNAGIWPDEYASFAANTPVAATNFEYSTSVESTEQQGAGVALNEGIWSCKPLNQAETP